MKGIIELIEPLVLFLGAVAFGSAFLRLIVMNAVREVLKERDASLTNNKQTQ